ncbi:MAG TPA: carbonic anhydrase family protein [Burkholderiaceae bacterium]|jgi:carbonic anhydrase|nr:carbonic anhydrase family protein [Burkholderiaceae bacterium]
MEFLRERLAAKLGGAALEMSNAGVIRVVNRAGDAAPPPAAAAPAVAAKPASGSAATAAPAAPGARRDAKGSVPAWSCEGAGGPAHWARLAPEFSACARGSRQSPIDIQDGIAVDLESIAFDYRASRFRVIDDGHTVRVDVDAGNAIEVLGRRYALEQFHFHRPAEEGIDGRQFAMAAHLVHRAADGRLAVVAVLLEAGSANPIVQVVWNNLPLEKGEPVVARKRLEPGALLPEEHAYYTYMGSLTTPPCSEGVLWMVMRQPVQLSAAQIAIFARLYPMNARPLQQAAGRLIKQSN